jgi:hypothetical protein
MNYPITIRLSSTALGKAACIKNLYLSIVEGYRPKLMPCRIVYGIAIHKFIHVAFQTDDIPKALDAGLKAFRLPKDDPPRNQQHLADERHFQITCLNLWTMHIQDEKDFKIISIDGKPLTEITFCIKSFYKDDIIDVSLEGTLDRLGQVRSGVFAVRDWKSTSSWDNNGYFEQFELSRQIRLYTLICKIEAERNPESTLGKIGASHMGCFIDAIFIKPNANDNVVKSSSMYSFKKEELEEFKNELLYLCRGISKRFRFEKHLAREGIINGSCEGKWGKCNFWNCCQAPANVEQVLLNRDFNKVGWNPSDYNNLGEI